LGLGAIAAAGTAAAAPLSRAADATALRVRLTAHLGACWFADQPPLGRLLPVTPRPFMAAHCGLLQVLASPPHACGMPRHWRGDVFLQCVCAACLCPVVAPCVCVPCLCPVSVSRVCDALALVLRFP
jgi:hypothetical protein